MMIRKKKTALILGSTLIFDGRAANGARHAILKPVVDAVRVEDVATYVDISQDLLVFKLQLTDTAAVGIVCRGCHLESGVVINVV